MDSFNALSDSDRAALIAAPACVTILIAGADRKIDDKEKRLGEQGCELQNFHLGPYAQSLLHPGQGTLR